MLGFPLLLHKAGGGAASDPLSAVAPGVALRMQREFQALTQAEQEASPLRCFSDVPTALPPHPCMLCNSAFGSVLDLRAHVTDAHHGMRHYRQRLAYLCEQFEAVGQVKPQLWRHALEAYTEEYVTGSNEWSSHSVGWTPPQGRSLAWTRVEGQLQPTLRQYSDCAVRLAKWLCGRCHPWVVPSLGVPLAELRAAGTLIVGDVAPSEEGEDARGTFLDFVLERMLEADLLLRPGGEGDADALCLNGELALSLASMDLLRALPSRDDFAPDDVLRVFLWDNYQVLDEVAGIWGRKVLENLRLLGLVERYSVAPRNALHAAVDMDVDHPSWCLPDERWRRPPWWLQESDVDPIQSVHTSNVNLDCLNGDPLADHHAGSGRRRVRARVPCVICARLGWDREYAHFWAQTKESGRTSVFGDAFTETPATSAPPLATSPVRSSAGSTVAATEVDAASSRDARERLWTFLDPNRYRRRWSFSLAPDGEADRGIPLEELEASSVRDPRTKKNVASPQENV